MHTRVIVWFRISSIYRSDEKSLDFSFNRIMMKLIETTDINVIKDCQAYFDTQPPSEILTKRRCKFLELEQYRTLIRLTACAVIFAVSYCTGYYVYCEYCLYYFFLFFLPFTVNKVMYGGPVEARAALSYSVLQ